MGKYLLHGMTKETSSNSFIFTFKTYQPPEVHRKPYLPYLEIVSTNDTGIDWYWSVNNSLPQRKRIHIFLDFSDRYFVKLKLSGYWSFRDLNNSILPQGMSILLTPNLLKKLSSYRRQYTRKMTAELICELSDEWRSNFKVSEWNIIVNVEVLKLQVHTYFHGVLSVYCMLCVQGGSSSLVCELNSSLWPFKWTLLSSTFMWYCLLCCTRWF